MVERYPGVDEQQAELDALVAAYPGLVSVRRIGTSRQGEPIRMASIGEGAANALVLGGPHSNEPVGGLTVRELGRLLCAEPELRAGLRWHLVPCIDPDAARLSESWLDRSADREAYARGFYRPDMGEQAEWTFPHLAEAGYFDRMLPETMALSWVIDGLRPVLMASLHNAEYGGVHHYTTGRDPELLAALGAVAGWFGLPVETAVFEVPGAVAIAPGVFPLPMVAELTEGMPPGEGAFGASSAEYALRHGTVTVVTEVPRWADARAADTGPCGRSLAEVLGAVLPEVTAAADAVHGVLGSVESGLRLDTPFRRSLRNTLGIMGRIGGGWGRIAAGAEGARAASVAEESAFQGMAALMRTRVAGTLLRTLDAELASGNVRGTVRAARARADELVRQWCEDADALPGTPIPLRDQAGVQLAAILCAAAVLRK